MMAMVALPTIMIYAMWRAGWIETRRDALLVGAVLTFSAAFVAVALYGSTRMRATAEPVVALFAAVAIVWLLDRLLGRRVAE